MKKVISMVMAAAMVTSLVPATAFAAKGMELSTTAKVVGANNYTTDELQNSTVNAPDGQSGTVSVSNMVTKTELQLKVNRADFTEGYKDQVKFTVTLDNADFVDIPQVQLRDWQGTTKTNSSIVSVATTGINANNKKDEVEITLDNVYQDQDVPPAQDDYLEVDDVIVVSLESKMDSTSKGKKATVSVSSDDFKVEGGDDLVYATVEGKGMSASTKKLTDIAVDEIATIEDVKLKSTVGDMSNVFSRGSGEIKLKLNSGFEFVENNSGRATLEDGRGNKLSLADNSNGIKIDEEEMTIPFSAFANAENANGQTASLDLTVDTWTFKHLNVEAADAKAGATATMKIYVTGNDTVSVEVAKAIDSAVTMSVDTDADLPVIYSGVNVDNYGITDSSDHKSLEVTIKESFPGAWNHNKDFTLTLPEGVYLADSTVDDMDVSSSNMDKDGAVIDKAWFADAYEKGDYEKLTFAKRTWDETDPKKDKKAELNFELLLVADPNFEGDVTLKLEGDAVDTQEVKIAKFVKPFTVKAEQNDLKIDYRQTKIPTNVTITEAEAGLWDKGTTIALSLDKIDFDDDAKVTVDEKSGLEVKNEKTTGGNIEFTVDKRSDDEVATVTVSDMTLFMDRALPAGAYDLEVYSPTMLNYTKLNNGGVDQNKPVGYLGQDILGAGLKADKDIIENINDDFYSTTAKAGFVNIVTAGREDADSFTTKVVVPVGSTTITAGGQNITLDVPAYINAANYTMLPLRAVAKALGIPNENVIWSAEARTVTVMYGSKVITMTVGQKLMYINGAPVPTSSAVEIKDSRTFLPLRDLGIALGVADITWDAATKTATLNGSKAVAE